MIEVLVVSAIVATSLGITLLVRWLRPGWTKRRVSMVSSAVLPGGMIAFCIYVGIDVALTPADKCGTDACGMAMVGAVMISLLCVGAYMMLVVLAQGLQSGLERR